MKKIYKPKSEKRDIIQQLIALGVKVTATNNEIIRVEIDTKIHDIKTIKEITKLDFEEMK